MQRAEFREDLRRAVSTIEDAGGQKILGYRAPTFSIVKESLWAVEILAEEGFLYDASVFPIRHDLYGFPSAPRFPFRWLCRGGRSVYEIPPTTVSVLGQNLPAAGGGYLRILPMWYTRWALERVRNREGRPGVVYFHPWELDPDQPRLPGNFKSRLRHYRNLPLMAGRLRELLRSGRFVPLKTLLEDCLSLGLVSSELRVSEPGLLNSGKTNSSDRSFRSVRPYLYPRSQRSLLWVAASYRRDGPAKASREWCVPFFPRLAGRIC